MKSAFTIIFMILATILQAQVSITHSDFSNAFAPGASFKSYMTPLGGEPVTVFVGEQSAAAQYWDFSGFTFNYAAHSSGITASAAPLISTWPDANLVLYEKSWLDRSDTMYFYNYKELTTELLKLHGVSDESSVMFDYDPPAIQAVVPLEFGSTWNRERDSTYIMEGYWIISEGVVTVDAFGTLKLPEGEFGCLRLQQQNITTTYTPIGNTSSETRSYHFYTKGMAEVNLPTILENQFSLTTIEVTGIKYSIREGQSGVVPLPMPAEAFRIEKISPNPLSGRGTIHFSTNASSPVEIGLFDCTGRKVTVVYSGNPNPGSHVAVVDASGLPDGLYFCKISGDGPSDFVKLIIRN